jgi:hypothetical protein
MAGTGKYLKEGFVMFVEGKDTRYALIVTDENAARPLLSKGNEDENINNPYNKAYEASKAAQKKANPGKPINEQEAQIAGLKAVLGDGSTLAFSFMSRIKRRKNLHKLNSITYMHLIVWFLLISSLCHGQGYDSSHAISKDNLSKFVGKKVSSIFKDSSISNHLEKSRFYDPRLHYLSGCVLQLDNKTQIKIYCQNIVHQNRYSAKRQWSWKLLKEDIITYVELVDYSAGTIRTVIYLKNQVLEY